MWVDFILWDLALRYCSDGNSTSPLGRHSRYLENYDTEQCEKFSVWEKKCWEIWSSEANTSLVGVQAQGPIFCCLPSLCCALLWKYHLPTNYLYTEQCNSASEWGIYTMGSSCWINNCCTASIACLTVTTLFISIWQCNYSCGRRFKYSWWSKYTLRKI